MTGIDQIKTNVKNRSLASVIALLAHERALGDEALDCIRNAYVPAASADLNHHKMTTGEDDFDEIMSNLMSMPFLASHRLVEVHAAEKLSQNEMEQLIDYLNDPCLSSILVLVFNKIEKKNKLASLLESRGLMYTLALPNEVDRINFVKSEVLQHGMTIGPHATQFLIMITNGDLLLIKNALEKLSILHTGNEISVNHIEENIVAMIDLDVFLLARLISEGNINDALVRLHSLRTAQENALKFLGVLIWQFRIILHIRHCLEMGMPDWDIRKQVSVFGDRYSWMVQVAKKRTTSFHVERLTKLLDCDHSLKTLATAQPFNLIEKFIYQSAVGV